MIIVTHRRAHPPTIAYINHRTREGKSSRDATRCLKRYLARNLYRPLENNATPDLTNIEASLNSCWRSPRSRRLVGGVPRAKSAVSPMSVGSRSAILSACREERSCMAHIEGEILIKRSVEDVIDFVADERNEPQYNPRMLRSEKITPGPVALGTQFRAEIRTMRRTAEMTIEFTA